MSARTGSTRSGAARDQGATVAVVDDVRFPSLVTVVKPVGVVTVSVDAERGRRERLDGCAIHESRCR
jgi:hypothetical protein